MNLVFGSNGYVGRHISQHLMNMNKRVTHVTRDMYDMSKPNNTQGLDSYHDIETIIWCSGSNHNDKIGSLDYNVYDTMMDVNVNGIVKSMDYLVSNNKIKDGARLCIISSVMEERGRVNKLSYTVSKSAVGGIVRASHITLYDKNILINSILPGPIDNEMTRNTLSKEELEKISPFFVNIEDICKMCYLLCFENTSITGQSIKIDNGISSKIIYA
jgi:3-oxoacyl-[acyl-carrier protein] reductase